MRTYFSVVPRKDTAIPKRNWILTSFGGIVILGMIVPLLMIDLSFRLYQFVYFGINEIPKVPRKNFIAIDRGSLRWLSWIQRMSCAYCDYANGLIAWIVVVVKTTEIYSCAIRHPRSHPVEQYQENYYPSEIFD